LSARRIDRFGKPDRGLCPHHYQAGPQPIKLALDQMRLDSEEDMQKSTGKKKEKCKNCEGKGTLKKRDKIVRCQRCDGTGIKR
jgi:DnaJ-class molecular chaperone